MHFLVLVCALPPPAIPSLLHLLLLHTSIQSTVSTHSSLLSCSYAGTHFLSPALRCVMGFKTRSACRMPKFATVRNFEETKKTECARRQPRPSVTRYARFPRFRRRHRHHRLLAPSTYRGRLVYSRTLLLCLVHYNYRSLENFQIYC